MDFKAALDGGYPSGGGSEMRNMLRNQQLVYFRLYEGQEEIVDQYGNSTGTYVPKYGDLMSANLCVSPNKGSTEAEQFGTLMDYDRTMTTSDVHVPIDENSVLWVDGADITGPWNYEVKKKAPWKNSIQFAISQVSVSAYSDYLEKISDMERAKVVTPNAEY